MVYYLVKRSALHPRPPHFRTASGAMLYQRLKEPT
jgi:hypothetical protein